MLTPATAKLASRAEKVINKWMTHLDQVSKDESQRARARETADELMEIGAALSALTNEAGGPGPAIQLAPLRPGDMREYMAEEALTDEAIMRYQSPIGSLVPRILDNLGRHMSRTLLSSFNNVGALTVETPPNQRVRKVRYRLFALDTAGTTRLSSAPGVLASSAADVERLLTT